MSVCMGAGGGESERERCSLLCVGASVPVFVDMHEMNRFLCMHAIA